MVEKIKKAKADTMMRVNNTIYAKITDAENSKWRSAFGEIYANAFINLVKQAENAEFLTKEPVKPVQNEENATKKRKFVAEKYDVREEESE